MTTAEVDDLLQQLEEHPEEDLLEEVDELSQEFVDSLVAKIMVFMFELIGFELFDYQRIMAARIIESVITNDGEIVTMLCSRQSGKTESVADAVAVLMILLPRLAPMYPELLGKFERGFWVGLFAPTDDQVDTIYSRIVHRLTSERAMDIMLDPEIDDAPEGGGKTISLKKSESLCRMQTAHPRAKIESKSYHLLIIDEAQHVDEGVVNKSISPMGAFYNASTIKLGTPDRTKGDFYKNIQYNKRRQTRRGSKQNHFEFDWKFCARSNPNYAKYVKKTLMRIGEDSDEFQLAYALKWLLDRGMFTTSSRLDELGDLSMEVVKAYWASPLLVGIDPARTTDSTVVTVLWVDWDRPDEFGYYDHRILNWLEIHGDQWEEQYFQILDFLANYNVIGVGVDGQGMGDVFADRIDRLLPDVEVQAIPSDQVNQSKRWKHLTELINRGLVSWPAHAKTRRLKTWRRFYQQMEDLEKVYRGQYMLAEAPDEADAHDDFPDSLALACVLTKDLTMPEVEESNNFFYSHRRS